MFPGLLVVRTKLGGPLLSIPFLSTDPQKELV